VICRKERETLQVRWVPGWREINSRSRRTFHRGG